MTLARPAEISLGKVTLPIPIFFPSISTVKTTLSPEDYLAAIYSLRGFNNQFLISAYDIHSSTTAENLRKLLLCAKEAKMTILMDSGNYESYWKDDQERWIQRQFHEVLSCTQCDIAFGFDAQNPPDDLDAHVHLIVERWRKDQAAAGQRVIIPIIHGTSNTLPQLCLRVVNETQVQLIAVAERRLGDGVFERTRAVAALREQLNNSGRYVGLHLLGTGNPISIALYSWAGADSFDGLEWCQTVVDHESGFLFHLSQADFFRQQTSWGDGGVSFQARTLAHNLNFYSDWMKRLREAVHANKVIDFCRFNFPEYIYHQCAENFGWDK